MPVAERALATSSSTGNRSTTSGYDIHGIDSIEENIHQARRLHPEIAQRVSVTDLREPLNYPTLPAPNYSRANVMCPKHACNSAPR